MGMLDDFTSAQVRPMLVPGEQILGLGYVTVWGSANSRGVYPEEPRLGAATDLRLILIHTELEKDVPLPQNQGVTEWWYEDISILHPKGENQRENWLQFALAAKPGCGPKLDGGADRVTVYGAPNLGFDNPMALRGQLVPWLLPRVQSQAFPPSPARAASREARFRADQAAVAQRIAANEAKMKAFTAALPQRLAYAGMAVCVLFVLLFTNGVVAAVKNVNRHEHAAASARRFAAMTKDKSERARLESHARDEDEYASSSWTDIAIRSIGGTVCIGGSVGMLLLARRLRRKAA